MDIRIPHLSDGVTQATVVSVLVAPGAQVTKDQSILELETDKAVVPLPAPQAGTISQVLVKSGDKVAVGQTVAVFGGSAQTAASAKVLSETSQAPAAAAPVTREVRVPETAAGILGFQYKSASGSPPAASPTVRKMARDLGIDLNRVRGTESGGRVGLQDLRNYVQELQRVAFSGSAGGDTPVQAPLQAKLKVSIDFSKWGAVERKPITNLRRVIGQRMTESWNAIPHVTQFDEADLSRANELRKKLLPAYEKKGIKLTVTAILIRAIVKALKAYPIFNSSLDEAAEELVIKKYIHLGVAVDTEAGLIVPVIRDADQKNLESLSRELAAMAEKTRQRKVGPEDLQGGSFTISNLGGIGGSFFTPIINRPEVAILGMGRGTQKPVVTPDGKIEARNLIPLGVSYDHRVIDGADGARFIRTLVEAIEGLELSDLEF